MALLAYDNPETSPVGSWMTQQHRESVADMLNGKNRNHYRYKYLYTYIDSIALFLLSLLFFDIGAILESLNMQPIDPITTIVRQLVAVKDTIYQETGKVHPYISIFSL